MTSAVPSAVRRRANTRARLLEAALDVFAEKGLRGATVDDLVGAAGFTRGAFYSNFSSLDEVFFVAFESESAAMVAAVRGVIDAIPEEEFSLDSVGLILESLHPFGRRWYLIHTEFVLFALRNARAREVLAEHGRGLRDEIADVLREVFRKLGRTPLVPIPQVTETVMALYLHSLAQEHLGDEALHPQEMVHNVLPEVVLGLSRPA
jgi:AcrR family transcriptional regulator